MKRLTLLAVALVMVLGMAVSASAAPEVSISGNLLINAIWKSNWDFDKDAGEKATEIRQRADLYFTVTANENLKGVLGFRSVKSNWGQDGWALDGAGGGSTNTIDVRDAYIDFNWPGTDVNVKAGLYTVALPQAVGGSSMIIGERAGAIMVSTPVTDNVSVLAGYTRLFDLDDNDSTTGSTGAGFDESYADGWLLAVPLSFEGVSATPYFLYADYGKNFLYAANYDTTTGLSTFAKDTDAYSYWIGTDFTMSLFDPFILRADLAYGKTDIDDYDANETSGWMFDAALDYTGFDFMTVTAYFAYTSGDDDDTGNGGEAMPILNSDWAVGSFFFGGGSITSDDINGGDIETGFWVVGLDLADIQSFAEGLTHTVHILYAKGTNDEDAIAGVTYGTGLTDQDSLWEVDFNTDYKIYDELTLYTQLGYINADFDKDLWEANGVGDVSDDAWKVATGVVYKF